MIPGSVKNAGADDRVVLRILATSDLHGHLRAFDYLAREEDPSVGLSRAASVIEGLRATARNSLLVDCGDFLTGGALNDAGENGGRHPVIAAMNALGYTAGTLGNHEFDVGIAQMTEILAGSAFPILSANVLSHLGPTELEDVPLTSAVHLERMAVTDARGGVRHLIVGIVGFTPPETLLFEEGDAAPTVMFRGILDAARAWVPELRRRGADVIVALCHSGIAQNPEDSENVAIELAALGGIDALILGHRHRVFPGPDHAPVPGVDPEKGRLHGVPAVMPGVWGRHVGCIDLALSSGGDGWRVEDSRARCLPIAERRPDGRVSGLVPCAPAILQATEAAHAARIAENDPVIGHLPFALHTYFSRVGYCPVTNLIARAQERAVAEAIEGTIYDGLPVVGLAAPARSGGIGGPGNYIDIPAGPLRQSHLASLYPFPNRVAGLRASGRTLRDWLERSVSAFATVLPGELMPRLIDPRFPAFDFDMAPRLGITVDITRKPCFDPRGRRIDGEAGRLTRLCMDGAPVGDEDELILAVNEYRGNGGGSFPGAGPEAVVTRTDADVHSAMRALFADRLMRPTKGRTFSFEPITNAFIRFRTGAGSLRHMADLGSFPLMHDEPLETGFHAFTLDLGAVTE